MNKHNENAKQISTTTAFETTSVISEEYSDETYLKDTNSRHHYLRTDLSPEKSKTEITNTKNWGSAQTSLFRDEIGLSVNGVSNPVKAKMERKRTIGTGNSELNKATSTEDDGNDKHEPSNCKYCKIRLSKLRLIERIKARMSLRFSDTLKSIYLSRQGKIVRNVGCQTSSAVSETTKMTKEEHENIALLIKNGHINKTDMFCKCVIRGREKDCQCGETDQDLEWMWDPLNRAEAADLSDNNRQVIFHKNFSSGTAAVRGTRTMRNDQFFWEIKMTTAVYGTDMMIGVGSDGVDLNAHSNNFCSMLGHDIESWGLSYDGHVQHAGQKQEYCSRYGSGTIIGVHLDMWQGTLAFFKNRHALGIAYQGLRSRALYPMACSTAARSGMKIISTQSFPTSLQFMCCQKLRQSVPAHLNVIEALVMPPGLKQYLANQIPWLIRPWRMPPKKASPECNICFNCWPLRDSFEGQTDCEDSDEDNHHSLHLLNYSSSDYDEENDSCGEHAPVINLRTKFPCNFGEGNSTQFERGSDEEDIPPGAKKSKSNSGTAHIPKSDTVSCETERALLGLGAIVNHFDSSSEDDSEMKGQSSDSKQLVISRKRKR